MKASNRYEGLIHYGMSLVGGMLGVYSILCFSAFFGTAQTANLIYIVTSLLGGDWLQVLLRVGGALLFAAAIVLTVCLNKKHPTEMRLVSIGVDAAAVVVLSLLPEGANPVLGMYPLFFATAFQWNCYSGAKGFACSSIFSTNNFRQFVSAATEVLVYRNRQQKAKAKFFGCTLLSFHLGAAAGFLLWLVFRMDAALFAILPLAFSLGLVLLDTEAAQAKLVPLRWKRLRWYARFRGLLFRGSRG